MAEPEKTPAQISPAQLVARIEDLERERKHLIAVIDILQEIAGSLHFVDILQATARKLGETFGLDRASIFLVERNGRQVRLVASYEDPSIRNIAVHLEQYPELERAMRTGETVFIADVSHDESLKHVREQLIDRGVKSITVVPITWRRVPIGAILLRTYRGGFPFSDADIRFVQVVASLAAKALRNAHRYERLVQRSSTSSAATESVERERAAVLEFVRRLLNHIATRSKDALGGVLADATSSELNRLVDVATTVFEEEAKGR